MDGITERDVSMSREAVMSMLECNAHAISVEQLETALRIAEEELNAAIRTTQQSSYHENLCRTEVVSLTNLIAVRKKRQP